MSLDEGKQGENYSLISSTQGKKRRAPAGALLAFENSIMVRW